MFRRPQGVCRDVRRTPRHVDQHEVVLVVDVFAQEVVEERVALRRVVDIAQRLVDAVQFLTRGDQVRPSPVGTARSASTPSSVSPSDRRRSSIWSMFGANACAIVGHCVACSRSSPSIPKCVARSFCFAVECDQERVEPQFLIGNDAHVREARRLAGPAFIDERDRPERLVVGDVRPESLVAERAVVVPRQPAVRERIHRYRLRYR